VFEDYKNRMASRGRNMGEVLKRQADMIMDATFTRDIAYRKCYLLDKDTIFPEQTLEGYKKAKSVFVGKSKYDPTKIKGFKPIDAKYLVHTYYSISGDNIDYYLQFRPLAHGINPNIRVGAFIFVPDDLGVYNLWLIVAKDDRPQFPQFYILKVNLLLKWYIGDDEVPSFEGAHVDTGTYFSWAVQRIQSSYNNGVWSDDYSTRVENQMKAIVPTNNDTYTILYNEHFVISDNPLRRITWEVSKLETTTTWGLTKLTFKQELEYDSKDNLSWINKTSENYSSQETGINYDYYCPRSNDKFNHTPVSASSVDKSIITYSGLSPVIKAGGGFKTFTANLYKDNQFVRNKPYWTIKYYQPDGTQDGKLICTLKFKYDEDNLVYDTNLGFVLDRDKKTAIYSENGQQLFGIQFKHDASSEHYNELQIKCLPILNMIGGYMVLSVDDDADISTLPASLIVGVEGL